MYREYLHPRPILGAVLFWLLFLWGFDAAWPDSGRASEPPAVGCVTDHDDATIIQRAMIGHQWPAERVKAHANHAGDIDYDRKQRVFALIDEAAAILAIECHDYDVACKSLKSLDAWRERVRARCLEQPS